jgi:hypothetical protein
MIKKTLGAVLLASLIAIPYANAGQPRTHDGLFLRLSGGVSFANTSIEANNGDEFDIGDMGGHGNFAIGGTIGNNLILHGTLFGWDISDVDVEIDDQEVNTDADVSLGAVGGGLTYYFEPSNIYISGSLGIGQLSFDNTNIEDSDTGLAADFLVGKEWWVGNSWGLGIAGDMNFHSMPQDGVNDNWDGVSFGVLFSATLN